MSAPSACSSAGSGHRCEQCEPSTVEIAFRIAEGVARWGLPVPKEAAVVLLDRIDEFHDREPGIMLRLMLQEPRLLRRKRRPRGAP